MTSAVFLALPWHGVSTDGRCCRPETLVSSPKRLTFHTPPPYRQGGCISLPDSYSLNNTNHTSACELAHCKILPDMCKPRSSGNGSGPLVKLALRVQQAIGDKKFDGVGRVVDQEWEVLVFDS